MTSLLLLQFSLYRTDLTSTRIPLRWRRQTVQVQRTGAVSAYFMRRRRQRPKGRKRHHTTGVRSGALYLAYMGMALCTVNVHVSEASTELNACDLVIFQCSVTISRFVS